MTFPNDIYFDQLNNLFINNFFFIDFNLQINCLNWNLIILQNYYFINFFLINDFFDNNFFFLSSFNYKNFDNISAIYHYSIPNVRLMYPEPFIASASFMHSDLWFMHILIYQYWLWFVFIFLIVFFFLTFITVVRWCNIRTRPKRETRGVSRSKCGDLITACVPVSWATSIIVNESTDAIDFFDGFGTTELVVGIRAYQWGWEYYYPKDLDLNYNIKQTYSQFLGNSIKYNYSSNFHTQSNNFFKFYQNKNFDFSNVPAYLIFSSFDKNSFLSLLNFNDIGTSSLIEANIFKKASNFFKSNKNFLNTFYNKYDTTFLSLNNALTEESLFLSSTTFKLNNQQTLLNNFNLNFILNQKPLITLFNYMYFTKNNLIHQNLLIDFNQIYVNQKINSKLLYLFQFNFNKSLLSLLNNNTDKFLNQNTLLKIFNKVFYTFNFDNSIISHFINFNTNNVFKLNLNGYFNNKIKNFSEVILINQKYMRNQFKTANNNYYWNFYTNKIVSNGFNTNLNLWNNFFIFNNQQSNLLNNKGFSLLNNHSPLISNTKNNSIINYDQSINTKNLPILFSGREDLIPNFLKTLAYNNFIINTSNFLRINNNFNYNKIENNFYLPYNTQYADYNFKNNQALIFFENYLWDQINSYFFQDEYLNLITNYSFDLFSQKISALFNINNRNYQYNNKLIYSINEDLVNIMNFNYSYSLFFENNLININLTSLSHIEILNIINNYFEFEDSFDLFKNLSYINNNNLFFIFNSYQNNFLSYFNIANSFKSNYNFTYLNSTSMFSNLNYFYQNNLINFNKIDIKFINFNYKFFKNNYFFNNLKLNYLINLRATSRNLIVNFNSYQKVFKAKLDENKSFANINSISNSFISQPNISSNRPNFETLLGKNYNTFFQTNLYKTQFFSFFNKFSELNNFSNFKIFSFPFLLSYKSDFSKYIWLDWYSRWNYIEVQPSSLSKFSLHGMPYLNKPYNYVSKHSDMLNETESYLNRISRARVNYNTNFTYNPKLFIKNNIWFKLNYFSSTKNLFNFKKNFLFSQKFWDHNVFFFNLVDTFNATFSANNTFLKTAWKPYKTTASYYYNISNLFDIFTRREYFFRKYFLNNNLIINLPNFYTNSINNVLINEFKNIYSCYNINYNNYIISDLLIIKVFSTINYFNFFNLFKNSVFFNNLFDFFFLKTFFKNQTQILSTIYKDQYKPLKKGVNSMLRLHATGAIAMPIEIRLQILASSKDVIHSWAIPSAGIKIDCVPGYSSHRLIIFLLSGIFWGQCMEICGRYHHWMPIIVYFMKRDLFFLWCTHFVFTTTNSQLISNDRQNLNLIKPVSFDKLLWLDEFFK